MTTGEFLNISALDPLLPTFLIATLCLCALSVITYYSLAIAWEVFWASRRSPSPLDPSAEVVLTGGGWVHVCYRTRGRWMLCCVPRVASCEENLEISLACGDGVRRCCSCPTNSAMPSLISPGLDSTLGWLSDWRVQNGKRCPGNTLRSLSGDSEARGGLIVDGNNHPPPRQHT